jgi:hypothetical protein
MTLVKVHHSSEGISSNGVLLTQLPEGISVGNAC